MHIEYIDIATSVIGLAGALWGIWGNRKASKSQKTLATAKEVVRAVVNGVEAGGHVDTKKAIKIKAIAAGVEGVLNQVVIQETKDTP